MKLSGYKLMWMMVMFDLPTGTPPVYFRFCGERECCAKYVRAIKNAAPPEGDISILFFTDKQFGQIINIIKRKFVRPPDVPEQLMLF